MDGLSGAASVIAVIQIAQSVGSALKDYYEAVRDAREDIQKLYDAVKSLETILQKIEDLIERGNLKLNDPTVFTNDTGPLRQAAKELEKLLLDLELPKGKANKTIQKVFQSLVWPFRKKDVEKTVAAVERHKSSLVLELGIENLHIASKHFDISTDIRYEIRAARDNKDRRHIVSWLSRGVPNPSKEHNLARSRHEETTGSWLLNSTDFQSWMTAPNSFLWLNGGAGAGKSILCSTAIDYIQQQNKNQPGCAVIYWYFTFTDIEKQSVENCTSSFIADICSNRRNTPVSLQDAYDQTNRGQQKPTFQTLTSLLREVVTGFEHIYIIIDALDECPTNNEQRDTLLGLLHTIRSWEIDALHILATSRKEVDIEESVSTFNVLDSVVTVSAQGSHVEEDIKRYLGHRMKGRAFQKWNLALKADVQATLSAQADGMFRLVALQLDALGALRNESKIRSTMVQLPATLDAFYDRILLGISQEEMECAFSALQWLAFSARPLRLEELAEAVVIQSEEPYLKSEDRFWDDRDLLQILPAGLVSTINVTLSQHDEVQIVDDTTDYNFARYLVLSNSDEPHLIPDSPSLPPKSKTMIQFAHFSVKEYLESTRIVNGPASPYFLDKHAAEKKIVQSSFAYMIYVGAQKPVIDRSIYNNFPLLFYAAYCWQFHIHNLGNEPMSGSWADMAILFLQNDRYYWQVFLALWYIDRASVTRTPKNQATRRLWLMTSQREVHPLIVISSLGLAPLLAHYIRVQKPDINSIKPSILLGHPLYAAASRGYLRAVEILISAGADVSSGIDYPLKAACLFRNLSIVQTLVEAGAAPDGPLHAENYPLSYAVSGGAFNIVRYLLENGADVNKVNTSLETSLSIASSRGNLPILQLLIEFGADLDQYGTGYPLYQAVLFMNVEVVQILLSSGANVHACKDNANSALVNAVLRCVQDRGLACVEMILAAGGHEHYPQRWQMACAELRKNINKLESLKREDFKNDEDYEKNQGRLRKVYKVQRLFDEYMGQHGIEISEFQTGDGEPGASEDGSQKLIETSLPEVEELSIEDNIVPI